MKKNRLKIISLVILSALMIYIWWGNFQTLSQSSYKQINEDNQINIDSPVNHQEIKYRKPKLNPFKRYSSSRPQTKPKTQQQKKQPQQTTPKLSTQYILQGIISDKKSSQAIITNKDGNSSIISLKEKVRGWELIIIDKNYIIFKNEKLYDTLRLQTIQ